MTKKVSDNAGGKWVKSLSNDVVHLIEDSENKIVTNKNYLKFCWFEYGMKPGKATEYRNIMEHLK